MKLTVKQDRFLKAPGVFDARQILLAAGDLQLALPARASREELSFHNSTWESRPGGKIKPEGVVALGSNFFTSIYCR